jgi:hypothetical protein
MIAKKWPPPEKLANVIAFVEDVWIEVSKFENSRGKSWHNWRPVSLGYHGCGCCSTDIEEPTHWVPLPEVKE